MNGSVLSSGPQRNAAGGEWLRSAVFEQCDEIAHQHGLVAQMAIPGADLKGDSPLTKEYGIALTPVGDHGELFALAIVVTACSIGVLVLHRQELPLIRRAFSTT